MKDEQCVRFLQWALPQLHMRWPAFRKVRKQVCKRVDARMRELGVAGIDEYKAYLHDHADEWIQLDALCRITISRFYRDQGVFATLQDSVLPILAQQALERGATQLRVWSAGCGSGEEPYTLAVLWATELQSQFPELSIDIVATDADPNVMRRARDARYKFGTLKNLPESWRDRAFALEGENYCLKPEYKLCVQLLEQDIRQEQPEGPFDLVLCRNLVFTYFDEALQLEHLKRIVDAMHDGAALVLGIHEKLPEKGRGLAKWFDEQRVYRKNSGIVEPKGV
ncbi:MAG: chemotaxis protein CheR [Betaproteobacteria bacterium]|nr:MAG: chemotaxis protein CheR [Betaproteobacteria bacterium]